ncbi:MAG: SCO family protein [Flavobacteriaceae bacterium]|nr:SCO family protein [Flavobacteriaceae bacterium]
MRIGIALILGLLLTSCASEYKKIPVLSFYINDKGVKEHYTIDYQDFINQENKGVDSNILDHKVSTANFFFTNCPSICPPMRMRQMELADYFSEEKDFMQVSITIDPKRDTVNALKIYSKNTGVTPEKWQFLRGDSLRLKDLSKQLMTNFEPNENGTDFYHSSYLALIDKKKRIRGFYDILKPIDVASLKEDIEVLLAE